MKIFRLTLLNLLCVTNLYAGQGTGNGGDVVVCTGPNGVLTYEVLDLYEARSEHGLTLDISSSTSPILAAIYQIDKFKQWEMYRAYKDRITSFMDRVDFVQRDLIDISDSLHTYIPKHCKVKQLAINEHDGNIKIDKRLWSKLNPANKAALIIHELIYEDLVASGHMNSITTRTINAYIHGNHYQYTGSKSINDTIGAQAFKDIAANNSCTTAIKVITKTPIPNLTKKAFETYYLRELDKVMQKDDIEFRCSESDRAILKKYFLELFDSKKDSTEEMKQVQILKLFFDKRITFLSFKNIIELINYELANGKYTERLALLIDNLPLLHRVYNWADFESGYSIEMLSDGLSIIKRMRNILGNVSEVKRNAILANFYDVLNLNSPKDIYPIHFDILDELLSYDLTDENINSIEVFSKKTILTEDNLEILFTRFVRLESFDEVLALILWNGSYQQGEVTDRIKRIINLEISDSEIDSALEFIDKLESNILNDELRSTFSRNYLIFDSAKRIQLLGRIYNRTRYPENTIDYIVNLLRNAPQTLADNRGHIPVSFRNMMRHQNRTNDLVNFIGHCIRFDHMALSNSAAMRLLGELEVWSTRNYSIIEIEFERNIMNDKRLRDLIEMFIITTVSSDSEDNFTATEFLRPLSSIMVANLEKLIEMYEGSEGKYSSDIVGRSKYLLKSSPRL
jgi:hypothetical protein